MGECQACLSDMEKCKSVAEEDWVEEAIREATDARMCRDFTVTVRTLACIPNEMEGHRKATADQTANKRPLAAVLRTHL